MLLPYILIQPDLAIVAGVELGHHFEAESGLSSICSDRAACYSRGLSVLVSASETHESANSVVLLRCTCPCRLRKQDWKSLRIGKWTPVLHPAAHLTPPQHTCWCSPCLYGPPVNGMPAVARCCCTLCALPSARNSLAMRPAAVVAVVAAAALPEMSVHGESNLMMRFGNMHSRRSGILGLCITFRAS